jgi:hypothetical protein
MDGHVIDPVEAPAIAAFPASGYHWQGAENKRFKIYIGCRPAPGLILALLGRRQVILVTDLAGEIVYQRERGWWERLWNRG